MSAHKEEVDVVVKTLREHLESHDNNRKEVQEKLHNMRSGGRRLMSWKRGSTVSLR